MRLSILSCPLSNKVDIIDSIYNKILIILLIIRKNMVEQIYTVYYKQEHGGTNL